jgi:putative flippase GtrA
MPSAVRAVRSLDWSVVRFLIVGVLSIATDATALFVLHGVFRIWLPAATAGAYGVAFVVNFGLNRIWVFRANGSVGRQLGWYIALVAFNLVFTVILVPTLTWLGLQYLVSKLLVAAVLAVLNYVTSRRWIFVSPPVRSV